ncbi:hypothetical protein KCTCHS21_61410 [Cohnella abietis]|uniref:Uncharacterized protein n=1 Tax=Cohnella abietis TaxID=2507935 RepID=A0A3T1DF76_9BACL|nr:hypothetical protein KCTCHS21_61410 [Cohnella abietis]
MIKSGANINEVIQNEENNFDFTLKVPNGTIYLELTEVVINKKGQSPYSSQKIRASDTGIKLIYYFLSVQSNQRIAVAYVTIGSYPHQLMHVLCCSSVSGN